MANVKPRQIQTVFFAVLFFVLFLVVARIFSPFFTVILWSALLYVLFSPLYHRITGNLDESRRSHRSFRRLLAGAFSMGSVVVIVIPLGFVAIHLIRQLSGFASASLDYLNANPEAVDQVIARLRELITELNLGMVRIDTDQLKAELTGMLAGGVETFIRLGTETVMGLGSFAIGLAFMVFTLYFFYVDGDYLLSLFVRAVPIRTEYMRELVGKFNETTRNLFLGYILVALFQAAIAFVLFSIFAVSEAVLFSVLLLFASFIPILGTGTIWIPLGISRVVSGDPVGGILFLILSFIFISTLDNFLRPLILKDRIKLHPLIIFFSILGGLTIFGFNGLILGPVVVIFFLTVLDLFLREHGISPER